MQEDQVSKQVNHNIRSSGDSNSQPGLQVLALIPAFNESARIKSVIEETRHYLDVLVIDDGSEDDTTAVAQRAGARVILQRPNQGKGAALRVGFRWAIKRKYIAVITLDADGQHDPGEIPHFLDEFNQEKPDLIIGQRDFSQITTLRRIANSLGKITFSWSVGQEIPDNQSGYRLISQRLMEELLDSQEQGFEFEVEMIKVCIKRGYSLKWVPIKTIYAGETSHISPLRHIGQFLRLVLETRRDMKRG